MIAADRKCMLSAERHRGLIEKAEALRAGLTEDQIDYRLSSRAWRRVHPDVYALAGVPETWEQSVLAATMWARGPASHRSAGALWEFSGIDQGSIEVITTRKLRHDAVVFHRRSRLPRISTTFGIPVTDPTDTLLDLAAVVPLRRLELAVDSALRRKLSYLGLLSERLEDRARQGRNGTRIMRAVIAARDPLYALTQSDLESMFLRLVKRYKLPRPVPQFVLTDEDGSFVGRPDFVYPDQRVAIELQSYQHHHDREVWEKDQARFGDFAAIDWVAITVTYLQMRLEPARVAQRIKRVLWSRSRTQSG